MSVPELNSKEVSRVSPARAEVSHVVEAAPEKVYGIISDYVHHHPRILPKQYFESLTVEKGGRGAGTVIRVQMKFMGAKSTLRLEVSEPEPGRVLLEADPVGGVATTFTVEPLGGGDKSRVTIATEWDHKPGFKAWVDRKINPRVARTIYEKELRLLDAYARQVG